MQRAGLFFDTGTIKPDDPPSYGIVTGTRDYGKGGAGQTLRAYCFGIRRWTRGRLYPKTDDFDPVPPTTLTSATCAK